MTKEADRKPGRPPVEEPLKKRYFRASDRQWEMFRQVAGENVSEWIRNTLMRAAQRKK